MSFGLRTWNEQGVLEMDTDTFTYQVIHNQLYRLSRGAVISVPIPSFTPSTCVATILPINSAPTVGGLDAMPYQSVSNGNVTISSFNPNNNTYGSGIEFRLIVMRYKN